jgi:hypothetical protein
MIAATLFTRLLARFATRLARSGLHDQVEAEANQEKRKQHPESQIRQDTGRVHRLIVQQSAGAHKAHSRDEYHKHADNNKSMPGAEAERAMQFIEMCTSGRIERGGAGQRENETD